MAAKKWQVNVRHYDEGQQQVIDTFPTKEVAERFIMLQVEIAKGYNLTHIVTIDGNHAMWNKKRDIQQTVFWVSKVK